MIFCEKSAKVIVEILDASWENTVVVCYPRRERYRLAVLYSDLLGLSCGRPSNPQDRSGEVAQSCNSSYDSTAIFATRDPRLSSSKTFDHIKQAPHVSIGFMTCR